MKRCITALLAGLAAGALVFIPMSAAQEATDTDVKAIEDIWEIYSSANVSADAEAWLSLWDDDAIKMSRGKPDRTLDELRASAPKKFVPGSVSAMNIDAEEIKILGDWAFSRGDYSVTVVDDGNETRLDGKFMTILKRQEDGSWRIFRDIAYKD